MLPVGYATPHIAALLVQDATAPSRAKRPV